MSTMGFSGFVGILSDGVFESLEYGEKLRKIDYDFFVSYASLDNREG
jgi:hypothetical protein